MKYGLWLLAACLLCTAASASVKLAPEGIEIDGGAMGKFTLQYPKFTPPDGKSVSPEVKLSGDGRAEITYLAEGTPVLVLTREEDAVTGTMATKSAGKFRWEMRIPITFAGNRLFRIRGKRREKAVSEDAAGETASGAAELQCVQPVRRQQRLQHFNPHRSRRVLAASGQPRLEVEDLRAQSADGCLCGPPGTEAFVSVRRGAAEGRQGPRRPVRPARGTRFPRQDQVGAGIEG